MTVHVDTESLLALVDGGESLADVERDLSRQGLTLDVEGAATARQTVAAWLAEGAPGARDVWLDPADHLVAGLDATLPDGRTLSIRPAPRRSVGPDLVALFVGMGGRFGRIERAHLRVHRVGVKRPRTRAGAPLEGVALTTPEARLLDELASRLRR